IRFNHHQQLTEDFAQVAPVDFIDDEDVRRLLIEGSSFAEADEYAILSSEAGFGWPVALNEIFVGVALVELDHPNPRWEFVPDQCIGQSAGKERFAHSRRALDDEILLDSP